MSNELPRFFFCITFIVYSISFLSFDMQIGYLQNLDSGLDSALDHVLTAIQAVINWFHNNVTLLPIYTHSWYRMCHI